MKILKIFGIVVAVHAAAFMFVFAIPGCRSTTRRAPSASETQVSNNAPERYYPGVTGYSTTTPPDTGGSAPVSNAELNPGIVEAPMDFGTSPIQAPQSSPIRYNPTRPNTPTASALQSAPVTDVQPVTIHTVVPRDSLWVVARKHGISVAELAAANNLKPDAILAVGKKLVIPTKAPASAVDSNGGVDGDTLIHEVKSGDSLSQIARRAGTTVGAIKTLNKLKSDSITVGQKLVLPANADTAARIAATPAPSAAKAGAEDIEYVVQPGETLSQIARHFGVDRNEVATINHITDPRKIRPGQKLILPGVARGTPPPAPVAAPVRPSETQTPAEPEPSFPVSPVSVPESSPISAPSDEPPVVPVVPIDGGSPISPAQE